MRFHAKHISTSVCGDYYQALFEVGEDTTELESPYLLIQRQFEDADGGRCYVETHDEKCTGHFLLRRIDFSPSGVLVEIGRLTDNIVEVTFDLGASDFEEVARVIDIIIGAKEAP